MNLPFSLPPRSRVLVAGAGGGFDVVCGLPVALSLRDAGCDVHLANYSFAQLSEVQGADRPLPQLYGITGTCGAPPNDYLPERGLARWWKSRFGEDRPVWSLDRVGVRPAREAYRYLRERLGLDAVVLVDGGVDGLFLGNEYDTGTPSMDAVSILAAASLDCRGVYVSTAFGTEGVGKTVRHADALRRIAELVRRRAFLGACAATTEDRASMLFSEAVDTIQRNLEPTSHSITAGSITAAMRGSFGDSVVTVRSREQPVWVSPLTLLYWFFDLEAVARAKPYADEVQDTDSVADVHAAIERYRDRVGAWPRADIPI